SLSLHDSAPLSPSTLSYTTLFRSIVRSLLLIFFQYLHRKMTLRPNLSMWMRVATPHNRALIFKNLNRANPFVLRQMKKLFLPDRSEEHTSELQSRENLVCRLLLEK